MMTSYVDPDIAARIYYLANQGFKETEESFDGFLASHIELLAPGAAVSPRTFKRLFEEHYEQALADRVFLAQQLRDIWGEHDVLEGHESEDEVVEELKETGDLGAIAKAQFDSLLETIGDVIKQATPRVDWEKHHSNNYQEELEDWLLKKYQDLDETLNDPSSMTRTSNLETVQECMAVAMRGIAGRRKRNPVAKKTSPNQVKRKFSSSHGELIAGTWWGEENELLVSSTEFEDVVKEYKNYVASDDKHPAGTEEDRTKMEGYLKRALEALNFVPDLGILDLYQKWDFRDSSTYVRTPAYLNPTLDPSQQRRGAGESLALFGSNEVKKLLGGGVSRDEESYMHYLESAAGVSGMAMVASLNARRSMEVNSKKGRLLGGGSGRAAKFEVRLRDPKEMWEQLLEDSQYPSKGFYQRARSGRPPMVDADRMGRPMARFRHAMESRPDKETWQKIQSESDPEKLKEMATRQRDILQDEREVAMAFIYDNPGKFTPGQPKLNEPGGKASRKLRYHGLRDTDFVVPVAHAFTARMTQIFLLVIHQKLFEAGECSLRQLLFEHYRNLEVWDEHEQLYMELENNRWFSLRKEEEISDLEARYATREKLRAEWQTEQRRIRKILSHIQKNPDAYKVVDGVVAPTDPSALDASDDGGAATLPTPVTEPRNKQKAVPPKASAREELGDETGAETGEEVVHEEESPSKRAAARRVIEIDEADPEPAAENNDDPMVIDDSDPGGETLSRTDRYSDLTPAVANKIIDFYKHMRSLYETKLKEAYYKNKFLDPTDKGNDSSLTRNNWDIMSKHQVLWALDTEIHNMERVMDPDDKEAHGRGRQLRWEIPESEVFRNFIKLPVPPKKLQGLKSLAPGPLLGERPPITEPRVIVGGPHLLGEESYHGAEASKYSARQKQGLLPRKPLFSSLVPQVTQSQGAATTTAKATVPMSSQPPVTPSVPKTAAMAQPSAPKKAKVASSADWSAPAVAVTSFVGRGQPTVQTVPYEGTPLPSSRPPKYNVPRDWNGMVSAHREVWKQKRPTATALLTWEEWIEAVYKATRRSTRDIREHFSDDSPFVDDEDLRAHIADMYKRVFRKRFGHDTMYWREREHCRHEILRQLASQINEALADAGQERTFRDAFPAIVDPAIDGISKGSASPAEAVERLADAIIHVERVTRDFERQVAAGQATDDDITISKQRNALGAQKAYYEQLYQRALARAEGDAGYDKQGRDLAGDRGRPTRRMTPAARPSSELFVPLGSRQPAEYPQTPETAEEPLSEEEAKWQREEVLGLHRYRELIEGLKKDVEKYSPLARAAAAEAERLQAIADKDPANQEAKKVAADAQKERAVLFQAYRTATNTLKLCGVGLSSQEKWAQIKVESAETLAAQFQKLVDFDSWAKSSPGPQRAADTTAEQQHIVWVCEVANVVHSLWKTLGQNTGPDHWLHLQYLFWDRLGGDTLAKRRRVFLHTLATQVNARFLRQGRDPVILPLPPAPPFEWTREFPAAEDLIGKPLALKRILLEKERNTLGQRRARRDRKERWRAAKRREAGSPQVAAPAPASIPKPAPTPVQTPQALQRRQPSVAGSLFSPTWSKPTTPVLTPTPAPAPAPASAPAPIPIPAPAQAPVAVSKPSVIRRLFAPSWSKSPTTAPAPVPAPTQSPAKTKSPRAPPPAPASARTPTTPTSIRSSHKRPREEEEEEDKKEAERETGLETPALTGARSLFSDDSSPPKKRAAPPPPRVRMQEVEDEGEGITQKPTTNTTITPPPTASIVVVSEATPPAKKQQTPHTASQIGVLLEPAAPVHEQQAEWTLDSDSDSQSKSEAGEEPVSISLFTPLTSPGMTITPAREPEGEGRRGSELFVPQQTPPPQSIVPAPSSPAVVQQQPRTPLSAPTTTPARSPKTVRSGSQSMPIIIEEDQDELQDQNVGKLQDKLVEIPNIPSPAPIVIIPDEPEPEPEDLEEEEEAVIVEPIRAIPSKRKRRTEDFIPTLSNKRKTPTPTTTPTTTQPAPAPALGRGKGRGKGEEEYDGPRRGIAGTDAWPHLRDLIAATTRAIAAHKVLGQLPGRKQRGGEKGRLRDRWPVPVLKGGVVEL